MEAVEVETNSPRSSVASLKSLATDSVPAEVLDALFMRASTVYVVKRKLAGAAKFAFCDFEEALSHVKCELKPFLRQASGGVRSFGATCSMRGSDGFPGLFRRTEVSYDELVEVLPRPERANLINRVSKKARRANANGYRKICISFTKGTVNRNYAIECIAVPVKRAQAQVAVEEDATSSDDLAQGHDAEPAAKRQKLV